ncbi:MAG: adenylate kinase [Candidatus Riflebacteria bacterium]|nr:adenylate kinase [Candidatus Riflebacteria bacterium]
MFLVLLMGPPGAGKGTQAQAIARRLGLKHLASGDVVRAEVGGKTEKGQQAKAYMEAGKLVPDDLMTSMVGGHIKQACEADGGVVLDGYPRTLPQARSLGQLLESERLAMDSVVNLKVPSEVLLDRLVFRLTCPKCNRVYHRKNNPPRAEGKCDDCQSALASRPDDNETVIRERLRVYSEQTQPVLEYYRDRGLLEEFDGSGGIEEVSECVFRYLQERKGA